MQIFNIYACTNNILNDIKNGSLNYMYSKIILLHIIHEKNIANNKKPK